MEGFLNKLWPRVPTASQLVISHQVLSKELTGAWPEHLLG
jgi:hypothetical protein